MVPHRPSADRSPFLVGLAALLRGLSSLSPLPVGRRRVLWLGHRPEGSSVADAYVLAWVAALVGCFLAADTEAGPYMAGVALFRYGDLVVAQMTLLVDPIGPRLGDPRRALMFAAVHAMEMVLVVGLIVRWREAARGGAALAAGFDALTFRGTPGLDGNWLDAARVLGGLGALVVLVGAAVAVVRLGTDR